MIIGWQRIGLVGVWLLHFKQGRTEIGARMISRMADEGKALRPLVQSTLYALRVMGGLYVWYDMYDL